MNELSPNAVRTSPGNPWPRAIILFFVMFIAFIVGFVVFASRQRMDLVGRDYYEREIRYQDQIDRVTRTERMSGEVNVAYNPAVGNITVTIPGDKNAVAATGWIYLYRPSDARMDKNVRLAVNKEGLQSVDASQLEAGLWKIRVEWEAAGQAYYFDKAITVGKGRS